MKIFEVYEAGKTERSFRGRNASASRLSIKYARSLLKLGLFIKVYRFEVRCFAVGGGKRARVFLHVIMHRRQLKRKTTHADAPSPRARLMNRLHSFYSRNAPLRAISAPDTRRTPCSHTHTCTRGQQRCAGGAYSPKKGNALALCVWINAQRALAVRQNMHKTAASKTCAQLGSIN
jgi:hypothetical protein